jgi:hypothetical protein
MTGSPLSITRQVLGAWLAITGVMLLVFSGLGAWGWSQHSIMGVLSAAVALGAMIFFRDSQQAVGGVFLGMLIRLGAPLLAGLVLLQSRSGLLDSGVLGMMVFAYLAGLLIETAMAWWILGRSSSGSLPGVAKAS